jgi:hypothetical protein
MGVPGVLHSRRAGRSVGGGVNVVHAPAARTAALQARDLPRPAILDCGSAKGDHPVVRSTRALLALVLTAVLIGLTLAAYADPPDPTWISGFWDDDDFDNAVVTIVSTCATEALAPVDGGPVLAPPARVEPENPVDPPILLRGTLCPRAPPVPSSPHC